MRPLQRLGQQPRQSSKEKCVPLKLKRSSLHALRHDLDGLAEALGAFLRRHAEGLNSKWAKPRPRPS
jgi:hypothetical protein